MNNKNFIVMKNGLFIWVVILTTVVFQACKKDKVLTISSFTASKGTYIGVVRIAVEPLSGAQNYEFQRKNPETNTWETIAGLQINAYDDYYSNDDHKLIAGVEYEYRARADNEDGQGVWCEAVTGYSYKPSPHLTKVKYEDGTCTVTLKDPLPDPLYNLTSRNIEVYRQGSSGSYFDRIISEDIYNMDTVLTFSCNEDKEDPPYQYQLKISYTYSRGEYGDDGWYALGYGSGIYEHESAVIDEDEIDEDSGGQLSTVNYTVANYNEINSSSSGAKNMVIHCLDGSTVYIGYLDGYSSTLTTGKPVLMKNSGSSWENAGGTMPAELLADNLIDEFDFDVSSGTLYLAALSPDTIYVYKNDGSWSANMATSLLWGTSEPNYLDIAVLNNELYLTIEQGDDIKVFKYNGTTWEQVGSDVATGSNTNTKLKNINGTLYIWYEEHVSGSSSCKLHIKHLNGTSWVSDLEWSKDNAMDFDIVLLNGTLYFIEGYGMGSVCKVESSSNATNLYESVGTLYGSPKSITTDASGNIIISCIATAQNVDDISLAVLVYDGTSWKKVNDDFSETSYHGNTSAVQASGNDIHFVYGLKSSENEWNMPTILKAKKYSK
ncbi:MAG: hypothetical protein GX660_23765 [Clostridiaceae bacterium]|nr:hypothetical protein [Clostridiaceae bacterium]